MNDVKNMSNLSQLFKEIYGPGLKELFNMYSDFKLEDNKVYYEPTAFYMPNILGPSKRINTKTLIMELV